MTIAKRISTTRTPSSVALGAAARGQIVKIESWLKRRSAHATRQGPTRRRRSYRALFHGPSSAAKTAAAARLGRAAGRDVYRVDLSAVLSKYIGETERNLGALFDRAAAREWILFFDESDALFGKRTDVKDSHDRYANQEVGYLLQRIEGFEGLAIFAANARANLDPAFVRRLNAIVRFPPAPKARPSRSRRSRRRRTIAP